MNEASFIGLVQNTALLLSVVLVFDQVSQNWRTAQTLIQKGFIGLIVGAIGVMIMLSPWVLMPGVVFDTRSILLGISGLFFGSVPTLIAMLITAALRLNQGGAGVIMGVSVIIATGSIGILWRKLFQKSITEISALELYGFGVVLHIVMLLLTLTLPTMQTTLTVLSNIGLPVIIIYPLGTMLLGKLMASRMRREILVNQIAENEIRYKIVADNTYDWEYWTNPAGQYEYCSPACLDIFGHTPEEFINDPDLTRKMFHPDDMAIFNKHRETPAEEKKGKQIEFRIIHLDGSIRWIGHVCRPVYDNTGKFLGIRGSNRDISDRKEAEKALVENEDKYRTLTEQISDVVWVMDAETLNFRYVSPSVEKLRGYTAEEIMSEPVDAALVPELREGFRQLVHSRAEALLNGAETPDTIYTNEVAQPCKDGSTVITEVKTSFYINNDTGHVEVRGVTRDITERKRSNIEREALLEIMQGLARTTALHENLATIHHAVAKVIQAENLFVVFYNKDTENFEEVYAVDQYDPPAPPSRLTRSITAYVFRTGQSLILSQAQFAELQERGEVEMVGTNSASWLGAPINTPDGPIGVIVVQDYETHDRYTERDKDFLAQISTQVALSIDRNRAGEAIRKREEEFRIIFEKASVGYSITSIDGVYLRVNPAFATLLGYTVTEITGKNWVDITHPEDIQTNRERINAVLAGEQAATMLEKRYLHKDGSSVTVIMSTTLLRDAQNTPLFFITNVVDITERKQAEATIQAHQNELQRLLEEADQSRRVLLGVAEDQKISDDIAKHLSNDLMEAYDATLRGWSNTLELRERETANHSKRVVEYTTKIATLLGFTDEEILNAQRGALLHDIGKMGVPDNILLKPGPLTDDEWVIMRMHPIYAFNLLSEIPYLQPALDIPYAHHERWNGSGYPLGLKETNIPLPARIFAVVDVWDALSSDRPYRPAWNNQAVTKYLKEQSGIQFDPQIVDIFLETINSQASDIEQGVNA